MSGEDSSSPRTRGKSVCVCVSFHFNVACHTLLLALIVQWIQRVASRAYTENSLYMPLVACCMFEQKIKETTVQIFHIIIML